MPNEKAKQRKVSITSIEEAAKAGRQIGELLRSIRSLENTFEQQRQAIDIREDEALHPLQTEALALAKGIFTYAQAHRHELIADSKSKTVRLPSKAGTLSWYTPAASIDLDGVALVLQRIKERGLTQFIRTKEEINKEALLEDQTLASSIAGVKVVKQEKFSIKPAGTKEKIECNVATKRFKFVPKT